MDIDSELTQLFEHKEYKQCELYPIPDLTIGQKVDHKNFGNGVILSINGDKCDVLFKSGRKTLLSRFAGF
jgi:hypothetical protein